MAFDLDTDLTDERSVTAGLTISQVNQSIAATLQNRFTDAFWVQGELQGFDRDAAKADVRRWGQVYFELVEKDPKTDTLKASIKAVVWGDALSAIRSKLGSVSTDLRIQDGLSVKFLCVVDFYWPRASLQLKVVDVDPHFTLGDMERARLALLKDLAESGQIGLNRALTFPLVPLRLGLITSEGSAAYHDFLNEIESSGYAFIISAYDAHTQGPETEGDVVRALRRFSKDPEVDVVVLIRGGGSRSDLIWFDKDKIARAIVGCAKPVITGIGHEIDTSVADRVAHTSKKTPTAAAQFLVESVASFDRNVAALWTRFQDLARQMILNQDGRLKTLARSWEGCADGFVRRHQSALREVRTRLGSETARTFSLARERLTRGIPRFVRGTTTLLSQRWERLNALDRVVRSRDPKNLFRQGYSLLTVGGKVIRGAADVRPGEFIEARLFDGSLTANVLGVTKESK